jgi:hypothetical protein
MLIKIELLTLISEQELVTAYFFERENKIILTQNFYNDKDIKETNIKMLRELIKVLDAEILYIEIGEENTGWMHLLTKDKNVAKIEVSLKVGICFAGLYDLPIFTQHEFLYKDGIEVTKELIEDTLRY